MAGPTQTKTGNYLKEMAREGHFSQKLGEAALALAECYCKADTDSQGNLGDLLATQVFHILKVVYGWKEQDARRASFAIRKAFSNVAIPAEENL